MISAYSRLLQPQPGERPHHRLPPPPPPMAGLLSKVSSAVAACARRVSRAARRLLRARRPRRDRRQLVPADDDRQEYSGDDSGGEEGGLWRRAILMGERCKPLDFPGAIHYDSFGRRLAAAPPPRGGKATAGPGPGALLCRSACDVDEAALAYMWAS
ncbi:hypothetical protein GQ55_5G251900 [Panicum hallii var. hallii]|uniref:Uncharacterized protein n=1 Tax=Panicum hallii var. hallii TaxID=1504633 RepID=A0A2T7DJZ8_9POAL|nr:hypothetical protein GQ55_5G251900 [Panicum hallii var. hallii]